MFLSDYEQVIKLWESIEGMGLRPYDDGYKGYERFIKRNPNTCFLVEDHGNIVATILAGHDGRRGHLYHVAVKADYRNKGLGKGLVDRALKALKDEAIKKVTLVVFKDNALGNTFWQNYGFELRQDLNYRDITMEL
jgi:ribosomal protein S18 acetylase RimI-like enzyme